MAKTSMSVNDAGPARPLRRAWRVGASRWLLAAMTCVASAGCLQAVGAAHAPSAASATVVAPAGSAPTRQRPPTAVAPRVIGRITAAELGVVINAADPYSVAVGEYYVRRRGIPPSHVLWVDLPLSPRLGSVDFDVLARRIDAHFGPEVQALALAWVKPYAVSCMSITGALALGLDESLCSNTCGRRSVSAYFNSASSRPWRDHGMRPSMLLAAGSIESAHRLIDRGIESDHSLGLRGAPPVDAWYMSTRDSARNVRAALFPPPGRIGRAGVSVQLEQGDVPRGRQRVLLVSTGLPRLEGLDEIGWVPGGLGDHLTSFGGLLDQAQGQTHALAWIDAGATASHGTVSEPCNHLQKFPHPQLLLLHYLQGSSVLETYWKSVAWPHQGVFVGEPLAAPFARQ